MVISEVAEDKKSHIDRLLEDYGVNRTQDISPLRKLALACVALPTCALAMAEAERYLPELTRQVETLLEQHSLQDEPISLRITGCPNGLCQTVPV